MSRYVIHLHPTPGGEFASATRSWPQRPQQVDLQQVLQWSMAPMDQAWAPLNLDDCFATNDPTSGFSGA